MTSIFENTQSKIIIHLLHDDTLTEDNRKKFIRTAEKYSQEIEFHDVSDFKNILASDKIEYARKRYSIGALYRLFIPVLLALVKKIIYFDCDVLVNMDIKDLWNVNMNGKTIAGALDIPGSRFNSSFYCHRMRIILNGSRPEEYINSGVLLMDLERVRERGDLLQTAIEWLARRGEMALAADQDAINSIFAGDIEIIDSKFNQNVFKPDLSNCIIHILWTKPWKAIKGIHSDSIYWKMFLRSAWGENISGDELIDKLNFLAGETVKNYEANYKPRRNIFVLLQKCFRRIIPVAAIEYIFKNICVNIKYKFSR